MLYCRQKGVTDLPSKYRNVTHWLVHFLARRWISASLFIETVVTYYCNEKHRKQGLELLTFGHFEALIRALWTLLGFGPPTDPDVARESSRGSLHWWQIHTLFNIQFSVIELTRKSSKEDQSKSVGLHRWVGTFRLDYFPPCRQMSLKNVTRGFQRNVRLLTNFQLLIWPCNDCPSIITRNWRLSPRIVSITSHLSHMNDYNVVEDDRKFNFRFISRR